MSAEELEVDRDSEDELKSIANMLDRARRYGLEVEVVWSFANELRSGDCNYAEAASNACHEWDL